MIGGAKEEAGVINDEEGAGGGGGGGGGEFPTDMLGQCPALRRHLLEMLFAFLGGIFLGYPMFFPLSGEEGKFLLGFP